MCHLMNQNISILVKENWLVYGMMEYFNQTNSSRAVDVLVKVRDPHDTHIFDKLLDWVNGSNKNQAITLFGFIVEKHPSWLHKVANHQLLKDVLKLLKVNGFINCCLLVCLCNQHLIFSVGTKHNNNNEHTVLHHPTTSHHTNVNATISSRSIRHIFIPGIMELHK